MNAELIRQYALRMARVYADKTSGSQRTGLSEDYLKDLEDKRDFLEKVAQLSPDSVHWEFVMSYINLINDRKASKARRRALYRFLQEVMKLNANASFTSSSHLSSKTPISL